LIFEYILGSGDTDTNQPIEVGDVIIDDIYLDWNKRDECQEFERGKYFFFYEWGSITMVLIMDTVWLSMWEHR